MQIHSCMQHAQHDVVQVTRQNTSFIDTGLGPIPDLADSSNLSSCSLFYGRWRHCPVGVQMRVECMSAKMQLTKDTMHRIHNKCFPHV